MKESVRSVIVSQLTDYAVATSILLAFRIDNGIESICPRGILFFMMPHLKRIYCMLLENYVLSL